MDKILIIDEDINTCILLEKFFSKNDFSVKYIHTSSKGLKEINEFSPAVIVIDHRLINMSDKNILEQIQEIDQKIQVIVISNNKDIKIAVGMIKQGVYDYMLKPLYPEELLMTVNKALLDRANHPTLLLNRNSAIDISFVQNNLAEYSPHFFSTESDEFRTVLTQIQLVAPTNYSVIIYGESGSGKEGVAVEIHLKSDRAKEPFIPIDCGTLSKELAASELFGHEKGSFTGAIEQKIGTLELANRGTIFLDEVSNLTYEVQVSLLRVVQQRKIRRIGGKRDIEIDIRIIVASNEQLWELTEQGKFRQDLFHRFNEFSISLPPLRKRKSDIASFSLFFLKQANQELEKQIIGFSPEVMRLFLEYTWPGNLRELKNVIRRAALLEVSSKIQLTALPFEMIQKSTYESVLFKEQNNQAPHHLSFILPETQTCTMENQHSANILPDNSNALKKASIGAEYEMILETIKMVKNNKSKAANLLQIDRKTLYNKLKLYKEISGQ